MTKAGSEKHRKLIGLGGQMSELDVVIQDWHDEVEAEMVLKIKDGTPPVPARINAINIVSNRRKEKYANKSRS